MTTILKSSSIRITTVAEATCSRSILSARRWMMDGLIVEEQRDSFCLDFDSGWDGVWTSEARIGTDGWTATIEIPFTTLNFSKRSLLAVLKAEINGDGLFGVDLVREDVFRVRQANGVIQTCEQFC